MIGYRALYKTNLSGAMIGRLFYSSNFPVPRSSLDALDLLSQHNGNSKRRIIETGKLFLSFSLFLKLLFWPLVLAKSLPGASVRSTPKAELNDVSQSEHSQGNNYGAPFSPRQFCYQLTVV